MKKPTKEPQIVRQASLLDIQTGRNLTSEKLRKIADQLDQDGGIAVEFMVSGWGWTVQMLRYETEEEAKKRYNRQMKQYNKYKEKEKENKEKKKEKLIQEAKKLGLKVEE